ncbi:hypothetical protein HMPREF9420_1333 [Segatella salivae DSM 15606]|uniref:Uncharacterized protein n=1 Tax=Segatella salivae DSM 15606 TaxID=888832 RepID=E6MPB5_9BACT|nr:hypothetical protein HMPREF9420_1333 [Segatella salivae DSM 15606]
MNVINRQVKYLITRFFIVVFLKSIVLNVQYYPFFLKGQNIHFFFSSSFCQRVASLLS